MIADVKTLRRRFKWGLWLFLIGVFIMTCRNNDFIVLSGLPIAIVGMFLILPCIKYRKYLNPNNDQQLPPFRPNHK